VRDWAQSGHLEHRQRISDAEAAALVEAMGWLSAYYLEAFASQLRGAAPAKDPAAAAVRASSPDGIRPGWSDYAVTMPE
jgi:hypothetical protein